jgi:hypothetical protein
MMHSFRLALLLPLLPATLWLLPCDQSLCPLPMPALLFHTSALPNSIPTSARLFSFVAESNYRGRAAIRPSSSGTIQVAPTFPSPALPSHHAPRPHSHLRDLPGTFLLIDCSPQPIPTGYRSIRSNGERSCFQPHLGTVNTVCHQQHLFAINSWCCLRLSEQRLLRATLFPLSDPATIQQSFVAMWTHVAWSTSAFWLPAAPLWHNSTQLNSTDKTRPFQSTQSHQSRVSNRDDHTACHIGMVMNYQCPFVTTVARVHVARTKKTKNE